MPRPQCLTATATGILRVFKRIAEFRRRSIPLTSLTKPLATFKAIWDTGATASVITQKVVDQLSLNLKPVGIAVVQTAAGAQKTEVYLVNLMLPNQVGFTQVRVTLAQIVGTDVLIAMDIIATGDFAITNLNGKTVFSFRWPSSTKIDFVVGSQTPAGRNDPCPCGSGNDVAEAASIKIPNSDELPIKSDCSNCIIGHNG